MVYYNKIDRLLPRASWHYNTEARKNWIIFLNIDKHTICSPLTRRFFKITSGIWLRVHQRILANPSGRFWIRLMRPCHCRCGVDRYWAEVLTDNMKWRRLLFTTTTSYHIGAIYVSAAARHPVQNDTTISLKI